MGRMGAAEVPPGDAPKAQAKAREFLASAESDLRAGRWSAAGLGAIHAGISAADAVLISKRGLRSTSQNHAAIVEMLDDGVEAFSAAQRRQLTGLIKMKNTVAYEQRPVTEVEARQLVDQARRLVRWSGNLLNKRTDDS